MNDKHQITPPPDLTDKWNNLPLSTEEIFVIAARWGADQELDACCEWLVNALHDREMGAELRAARRPKPPSLKEQGLESLDEVIKCLKVLVPDAPVDGIHIENIRRAMEALPND
jgi:hypothetical protein